jgi:hypothetical protein
MATLMGLIPVVAAFLWWFVDAAARTGRHDQSLRGFRSYPNSRKFLLWRVFGTFVLGIGLDFSIGGLTSGLHVLRNIGIVLLVFGLVVGMGIAKLGLPTQAFMDDRKMNQK